MWYPVLREGGTRIPWKLKKRLGRFYFPPWYPRGRLNGVLVSLLWVDDLT